MASAGRAAALIVSPGTELEQNHLAMAASAVQLPDRPSRPLQEVGHQATSASIRAASVARRKSASCTAESCDVYRASTTSNDVPPPRTRTHTDGSVASSLVAPTRVEADLLRAVRLSTLLQRCAAGFASQECVAQNYQMSFETDRINDFVSHDWASGRISKMLALCLVYNSAAATSASLLAGLALGVLQYGSSPIIPVTKPQSAYQAEAGTSSEMALFYGHWCVICCPIVFWVFFLFWQEMRFVMGLGTRSCFLDKYCIDQSNPQRKAAGILGLAGFLRCSDSIVILWTPRYFTRLWCTYEMASWLHLQKPLASVNFMPLALAKIVVTWAGCSMCSLLVLVVLHPYFPQLYTQIVAMSTFLGFCPIYHQVRHCVGHLRAIPEQLANFSVTSSQCFCCSVGHSRNGDEIPCDREVVYSTIADWFNDGDGPVSEEAALDRFDRAVRLRFAAQVLQKVGPTRLPFRYVIVGAVPFIFRACDAIPAIFHFGGTFLVNTLIMYVTLIGATLPLVYKVGMKLASLMDSRVGIPRSKVLDYLSSLALAAVVSAVAFVAIGGLIALSRSTTRIWPTVLAALAFWSLNLWVHYEDLKQYLLSQWPAHGAEQSAAVLPAQTTDAVPLDVADEGACLDELEAVRISQVADSDGGEEPHEASSRRSTDEGVPSERPLRCVRSWPRRGASHDQDQHFRPSAAVS